MIVTIDTVDIPKWKLYNNKNNNKNTVYYSPRYILQTNKIC